MHAVLASVRFGNNQPCTVMPASTLPVPYTMTDEVSEIKKHPLAGCKDHNNVSYKTVLGGGEYSSCIDESEGVNRIVGKPDLKTL